MGASIDRVTQAAEAAGLRIEIVTMPASTRTAQEAAAACGCDVAQIVKSLVFQGADTGILHLLLVSGANRVDMARAKQVVGEALNRADPTLVRENTGFAIGGVAPLGHLQPIGTWMDEDLLGHDTVWAAAGAPNAVFEATPADLRDAAGAKPARLRA
jgi:prolyl-tRNA editing enzyme YbaK/EbsC (Cys-tRNA(Pro) deacylase)